MYLHQFERMLRYLLLVTCIVIGTAGFAVAENWPQWRGQRLDSVSDETGLDLSWKHADPIAWRVPLPGSAGASPVVWGERVLVSSVRGDELWLICFDTNDGKQLWKRRLEGRDISSRDSANGASPSPATDGKHVWVTTGAGMLQCFTCEGEPVWTFDLQKKYGKFNIQFGMSTTPILHDGNLFTMLLHGDMKDRTTGSTGHVLALDAATGAEVWHQIRETDGIAENKHSYASPVICHAGDQASLIVHGADYVTSHSLSDGTEQWRQGGFNPKGDQYNPFLRFVASPVFRNNLLVVPSAKNGPVVAVKTSSGSDATSLSHDVLWEMTRGTPDVATPVIYQGYVYLARENGTLLCVDARTGEVINKKRLFADRHRSTPVAADGKLFVTCRDGKVVALKAGAEFEELGTLVLASETTASPAISNGVLYVRTFAELVAIKLTE